MAEQATKTKNEDIGRVFQDVKQRANLAEYIASVTGTQPKRMGNTIRFNPCPFCSHNDCFNVFGENLDAFKCQSCEAKGDVFNFAEEWDASLSKGDALRAVAQFAGVQLPERKGSRSTAAGDEEPPKDTTRQRLLEAAVAYYRRVLERNDEVLTWLTAAKPQGRGHTRKTIEQLELGLSDGNLHKELQAKGFTLEQIKASGLYAESAKKPGEWRDFFLPGLAIFPHRLASGEVAHFTFKDPRKKLSYQLRAEHRIAGFAWGNQKAIRGEQLILCEGENDLASFVDAGVRNVLASLGSLSDEQIRWLEVHSHGKKFVLWFDYDKPKADPTKPLAGLVYTRKVYKRLLRARSCEVSVASALMEPGEDPDDWIQKDQATAPARIAAAVKKAHNPLIWELKVMPADVREDASAALKYLEEIDFFESLALLPDLARDAVVNEMQKLGFARDSVLANIKQGYDLQEQIGTIVSTYNGSTKSDSCRRQVATAVWEYFKTRGKFFVSGSKLHLFYHHTIYELGDNIAFKALMHREAGLNIKMDVAPFVWQELMALCYTRGDRLTEFGWISLVNDGAGDEQPRPTLYLNLKDPANRIMRVTSGAIDVAENGTNAHNVLLAEPMRMKTFKYDHEVNVAAAMRDLKALVLDSLSCEPAQRYLLLAWSLATYLLPFCSTRGLMKMEGMSQSGKTTAAKFMSLLLFGDNIVGRSSTASDYSMAATEPLIIKDNMETDDINRNVLNFLLLAATGATNVKRSQGTESGTVSEKINCLVAITAIEPFAKPELINRTFILEFSPRWKKMDFVESEAEMKLLARRDDIISAWLQILSERILPSLDDRGEVIKYIRKQHREYSKERVTEFTALLVLICRALTKYIPLPEDLKLMAGDRAPEYVLLDAWIKYQNEHSRQVEQGTNQVLRLLDGLRRSFLIDFMKRPAEPDRSSDSDPIDFIWSDALGVKVYRQVIVDHHNQATQDHRYWFDASTADLLTMLTRHGRDNGIRIEFTNPKQLGVRIANEMATLQQGGWQTALARIIHGTRITRWQWCSAEDAPNPADTLPRKTAPEAQSSKGVGGTVPLPLNQ